MADVQSAPGVPEAECPSEQTMAAYFDASLSAEDRDDVEAHVASCERCLELVAETGAALAQGSGLKA